MLLNGEESTVIYFYVCFFSNQLNSTGCAFLCVYTKLNQFIWEGVFLFMHRPIAEAIRTAAAEHRRQLRPSLDIVLSPHRTQFHLARCLARSKHGCNLDTAPNWFKFGDERFVGTLSFYPSARSGLPRQVLAQCLIDVSI